MTSENVVWINLLLNLDKTVVILLAPESRRIVRLEDVCFILVSTTAGRDLTQRIECRGGIGECFRDTASSARGWVDRVPDGGHFELPERIALVIEVSLCTKWSEVKKGRPL